MDRGDAGDVFHNALDYEGLVMTTAVVPGVTASAASTCSGVARRESRRMQKPSIVSPRNEAVLSSQLRVRASCVPRTLWSASAAGGRGRSSGLRLPAACRIARRLPAAVRWTSSQARAALWGLSELTLKSARSSGRCVQR